MFLCTKKTHDELVLHVHSLQNTEICQERLNLNSLNLTGLVSFKDWQNASQICTKILFTEVDNPLPSALGKCFNWPG